MPDFDDITILRNSDREALYIFGRKAVEGPRVTPEQVIAALGMSSEVERRSDCETAFPETL